MTSGNRAKESWGWPQWAPCKRPSLVYLARAPLCKCAASVLSLGDPPELCCTTTAAVTPSSPCPRAWSLNRGLQWTLCEPHRTECHSEAHTEGSAAGTQPPPRVQRGKCRWWQHRRRPSLASPPQGHPACCAGQALRTPVVPKVTTGLSFLLPNGAGTRPLPSQNGARDATGGKWKGATSFPGRSRKPVSHSCVHLVSGEVFRGGGSRGE